jgi:hypothetical protein
VEDQVVVTKVKVVAEEEEAQEVIEHLFQEEQN